MSATKTVSAASSSAQDDRSGLRKNLPWMLATVAIGIVISLVSAIPRPGSNGEGYLAQFMGWIAALPPLAQVPLVVLSFLLLVAVLLFFLEVAPNRGRRFTAIRLVACVLGPVLVLVALGSIWWAAIAASLLGALFFFLDYRAKQGVGYLAQLVGFLSPAVFLLLVGLVYPTIQTVVKSFMNSHSDRFVGFDNFAWIFTQSTGLQSLANTIIWVLIVPTFATGIGLGYAAFIDRSKGERVFKILVFMPMAISLVGASIIWRFVYTVRPADQQQIGLLNQVVLWLGGTPTDFLSLQPWNNLFLMVVLVWIQTGFAMVVLSAAIKGVPAEQLEAAELDGTNRVQRFVNVTIPGIRGALIVVFTTISIGSLKVFDIVRTMTAGTRGTTVLANEMYTQWQGLEHGRSAALAVILFVLVLPIIVFNARNLTKQKEIR